MNVYIQKASSIFRTLYVLFNLYNKLLNNAAHFLNLVYEVHGDMQLIL